MNRAAAWGLLLSGCANDASEFGFVSPFDGQTDWPPDAPLQVRLTDRSLPEGAPTPQDLVRVVDLDDGGLVEGELVHDGPDLWFFPDEPFAAGHRFAWEVGAPDVLAREPELAVVAPLRGDALFSTSPRLDALDAVAADGACVLLSRAPRDGEELLVAVGGVVLPMAAPQAEEVAGIEPAVAQAQTKRCVDGAGFAPGDAIRVQVGSRVWKFDALDLTAEQGFEQRYRVVR